MPDYALRIAKGSGRAGRCGACGERVMWAVLAQRGAKRIRLVESPKVLRTETGDNDVRVELLGFDQIHRCQARKTPRPSASSIRSAPPPAPAVRSGDGVYASFTRERIQEMRRQLETPKSKEPQSGRLW